MNGLMSLGTLSDTKLIAEVARLAACERQATAHLIACLAEMDARRLYLGLGCTSLFTYCTQVLHFSEHAAYGRIEAARIARRFPDVLHWLADGSVTLTAICMLSPHLTAETTSSCWRRCGTRESGKLSTSSPDSGRCRM